jgi:hypothetical protein
MITNAKKMQRIRCFALSARREALSRPFSGL